MLHNLLHAMRRVFALHAIAGFFDNDANKLVSARGRQVLNDPALMAQVHEQLAAWKEAYKRGEVRGPCVVHLGARAGSPLYLPGAA